MSQPCPAQTVEPVSLPVDLLERILCMSDSIQDLLVAPLVCRAWREAAQRDGPWDAAIRRDHPAAEPATLAVLQERARGRRQQRAGASRQVYRALAQSWTCDRCQQAFTDGCNTPASCCFHPGILFSGGLMNGAGLRFTCCNRRAHHIPNGSRDANGCATAHHAGGGSAWQRHGSGVKPRELPPEAVAGGAGTTSSSSGGSSSPSASGSPSRPYPFLHSGAQLQEWHPNMRPGLLELPSRLFAASSKAA